MAKKEKKIAIKGKDSSGSELKRRIKQNPALYIGSVVILVLVIVTFVGGDLIGRRSAEMENLIFGYYDKVPISWVPGNIFSQFRDQAVNYIRSQGGDINDYSATAQVFRQAFEATAVHTAILLMLKKSGYTVPEHKVNRIVMQRPEYQENGRFSSVMYNRMPESSRLVIWRQTQDEIAKNMYYNDFYSLLQPSGETDFIAAMSSPMRNFQMVYFKINDFPDSEYLAYAGENSELFDSIRLSKITVSSQREAGKILDSIKNGTTTFEDAARGQSQDIYKDNGGDMEKKFRVDLGNEIPGSDDRDRILKLGRGEYSDVIPVGEQWAFFRVEEELTPADFNDSAVMEKVRSYIRGWEKGRMDNWAVSQAEEFISEIEEVGLNNAAGYRGLPIYRFGPFPINYGGIEMFNSLESNTISDFPPAYLSDLSKNENFWKIAFSTKLNTPSEPIVQGDNVLVLIPTEEIQDEEESTESLKSMYSYYLYSLAQQSLPSYFTAENNEKMDDRFWPAFFRYVMPQ